MALSEASKERVRLEADFINTLAGNIFAIGVLAPILGYAFGVNIPEERHTLAYAAVLICFGLAIVLHFYASAILEKDRQMNDWLLILPVIGIVMLVMSLWVFHRVMPLQHVDENPEEKTKATLAETATTFASYVVNVIRAERSSVVHAAAIREMRISANITPHRATESEIEEAKRAIAR